MDLPQTRDLGPTYVYLHVLHKGTAGGEEGEEE